MTQGKLAHSLLSWAMQPGARRFRAGRKQLEQAQRQRMSAILRQVADSPVGQQQGITRHWRWEDVAERLPVTEYVDWGSAVRAQMEEGVDGLTRSPVQRYQPTSGSSSAIKWIPYTRQFLQELDSAIAPWLADLYRRYPGIGQGHHYWSLSWLPTEMRKQVSGHINDDMKLLSRGKRSLASRTQAVPESVSMADTSDDSLFATLAYLAADPELSAMSIWSPTFGLGLLERLSEWRMELAVVMEKGHWGQRSRRLPALKAPYAPRAAALLRDWNGERSPEFYQQLWPNLALISAWGTAAAAPWAETLKACLPHADFQGKGLWATEGVVTIPQGPEGDHVLAVNSHAYEFEDTATGRILPPWELEKDQEVVPLMTTGSGFLRYRLGDRVRVTGFDGALPCLTFLGRDDGVDMVGEKTSTVAIQQLLERLSWPAGIRPVTVLGAERGGGNGHPAYILLAEAEPGVSPQACAEISAQMARQVELGMMAHFHYQLARNLGQLDTARCICRQGVRSDYITACTELGMIDGDIKVEALKGWPGELPTSLRPESPEPVRREVLA